MRKKFILFVLVPGFLFLLLVYLFIDSWVESGLEYAGEKIVGAKVEIDNLVLSLSPAAIEFSRLQVANPQDGMENIFETSTVKFALDFGQLLRSKFIIETMEVNNLILGTKRTTDGSLGGKPTQQPAAAQAAAVSGDTTTPAPTLFSQQAAPVLQAKEEKKTPVFDLDRIRKEIKIDSILNVQNLRAVQYYDSLRSEVQRAGDQWQTALAEIDKTKPRIAEIETTVKAINVSEIKSLGSAKSAFENIKKAYDYASEVSKTFNDRKTALNDQLNRFSNAYNEGERLAKEDFNSVVSLARLPDVSMQGLAELVLGGEMMQNVNKYLYWIDFARDNVPAGLGGKTPKEEPRHRFEGQVIHFLVEKAYPKFWIKKISVSGGTEKAQDPEYFYLKGEVRDISNNQRTTGQALTLALSGTKGGTTTLGLNAKFDRRKDLPVDDYHAKLAGLRVADMQVGRSDFLPSKITKAVAGAAIDVDVPGTKFESTSKITFSNVTMVFENEPKSTVERIVKDVLASLNSFNVTLRLWNSGGKFDMAFATDLDDQISSRARKVIGDEIARVQNEIRRKVNERIAEKRKEFETIFNQKKEDVMGKLKGYEGQVNEKMAMVEGKKNEVQNKIDEETKKQTEGVKKKAEETIKSLFKKN